MWRSARHKSGQLTEPQYDGAASRQARRAGGDKQGACAMIADILNFQPLIALLAGLMILLVPRALNYVVAFYLILVGIAGMWPHALII
jgi:hypothetical protein